ncbi:GNAT family N-acetyltransferase [Desulfosporosinus lacus]|uniref:Acetyltransferase (GNAT) domain-containing protein n=1 Tax=Desulfosporosinus lacus DSM 15449 TaxID=1121420 RepID=A0A1M5XDT8_9FIRM|nr:GNAT family N-acetyltransferase [Desulfosporosinus lacus]SHH97981.1 Acetyltransferase (GNAT) domain-containing protein [Desulfosporosinus lacus DSM 15449]
MRTCINEISFSDYLLGFKLDLPPIGTYYVNRSLTNNALLLGAYLEDTFAGIVILEFAHRPILTYVFVEERFRRQNIGTQLVEAAMTYARDKGAAELGVNLIQQNEYGEVMDQMLRKIGFEIMDSATIIRYANDEHCSSRWAAFMEEKGKRICKALAGRGFKTLPFSEVPSVNFDKLKAAIGGEFPSNLDPFSFIHNQNDRIVPEYSFITLKDDQPVAFVTVTTVDNRSLVFQQLSTALSHRSRGVFLLPFAAFMERFLAGDSYRKLSAVVLDKNDKMQKLIHSLFGALAESIKVQNYYEIKFVPFNPGQFK